MPSFNSKTTIKNKPRLRIAATTNNPSNKKQRIQPAQTPNPEPIKTVAISTNTLIIDAIK